MKLVSRLSNRKSSDSPVEEHLLTGWGRTAPSRARVVRPRTYEELQLQISSKPTRGHIPRGLGRSYGDPAQNAGGTVIDMTGFDAVLDVDINAAIVTVEAGMNIHRMMELFVPLGLFVPVTPGTRYVTVGGAIASDIHGKNHHVDGAFGNHVRAMTIVLASGETIAITRQTHPDLFAATVGGMGLTGLITSATIQMIRIDNSTVLVDTDRASGIDNLLAFMREDDDRYRYSVAWVDTLATGSSLGRGVLYRGNHLQDDSSRPHHEHRQLLGPRGPRFAIPPVIPSGLVGLPTALAFNNLWFWKHPHTRREEPQQLSAFFHQLDMVDNTNRVYGPSGLVQHQCVLPADQTAELVRILEMLSSERVPTYLVVLKRMGRGNGLLSFPIEGWTLAIDVPAAWQGLNRLLNRIDEIVLNAGGRLYFAKDSRMNPDHVPAMYPQLGRWRSIADAADPERTFRSDLSRRLGIRDAVGTASEA